MKTSSDTRSCAKCNKTVTLGKPDPCLGYLPDVAHACCGHGKDSTAFVNGFDGCKPDECITTYGGEKIKYKDGYWIYRGQEAIEHMEKLKNI